MNIEVNKNQFSKFLDNNLKVVDPANTNFAMRCLMFNVYSDKIVVTSNNNEIALQNIFQLDGVNNKTDSIGNFLVLAKSLKSIINECESKINLTLNATSLKIESGTYKTEIKIFDISDFPDINFTLSSNKFNIKSELLIRAFKNVGFVALNNPDKDKLIQNSLNLYNKEGNVHFMASDAKRIALEIFPLDYNGEFNFSIHSKTVKVLQSITFAKEIVVYPGSYEVYIQSDSMVIKSKIVNLPHYNLEQNNPFAWDMDIHLTIQKQVLTNLIDKVTVLSDQKNNSVRFRIEKHDDKASLTLSTYIDGTGNFEAKSDQVEIEGPNMNVSYNSTYLREAISPFEGELDLFFNRQRGAIKILSAEYIENQQILASIKE